MTSLLTCFLFLSFQFLFSYQLDIPEEGYFLPSLSETITQIIYNALNNDEHMISEKCKKSLNETILSSEVNTSNYYIQKSFSDSSKNKNDFLTYSSCMSFQFNSSFTPTYLFVTLIHKNNNNSKLCFDYPKKFSFGLCVPSGCNEEEYKNLTSTIIKQNDILFDCNSNWLSNLFEVNSYDKKFTFTPIKIFTLLPVLLIIIQILLNIFPSIPYWLSMKLIQLLQKCIKDKSPFSKGNFLKKSFLHIKKAFSLAENSDELFNSRKQNSKINNVTGLSYIKLLRFISMIFYLLGTVFTMIMQSPSYIKSEVALNNLMKSSLFGFISFGIRYAPRIMLSCSGFSLTYKLFCFLDDQLDENDNDEGEDEDNQNANSKSARTYSDLIRQEKEKQKKSVTSRISHVLTGPRFSNGEVLWNFLFCFIKYQLHKYVITLVIMYLMKWSIYNIFLLIDGSSPLREYYYRRVVKESNRFISIILQLLLIRPFLFINSNKDNPNVFVSLNDRDIFYDYYWLIFNEMIFFTFTSLIIWLIYKEKYSLNYFCALTGIGLLIARFLIILISKYETFHYFSHLGYGLYFICPFNNYNYYLIGVYFGLINYSFQKNISLEECEDTQRLYIMNSIHYITYQQKNTKAFNYFSGFGVLFVIIFFSLFQCIVLFLTEKNFVSHLILKIIYSLDIELIVYLIHRVLFAFYIKGDNIVHSFMNSRKWEFLNKLYFCFILMVPTVTMFFLYQSDNRIYIGFGTIVYYSLNVFVFTIIMSSMLYVLFEIPLKRVIKFWVNVKEKKTVQSQMIELNSNPMYQGEFNCIYGDDAEEEEEEEEDSNKPILGNI